MRHYEPVLPSNFISESTDLLRHTAVPEAQLTEKITAWEAQVEAVVEKYPDKTFTEEQRIGGLLGWLQPGATLSRKANEVALIHL